MNIVPQEQTETGMSRHGVYTPWTVYLKYRQTDRQRWRGVDMVYIRLGHCPLRTDRQRWRGDEMVYIRHGHCTLSTDRQTDRDGEESTWCIHDIDIAPQVQTDRHTDRHTEMERSRHGVYTTWTLSVKNRQTDRDGEELIWCIYDMYLKYRQTDGDGEEGV